MGRVITIIFILIAVVLGILAVTTNASAFGAVVIASRFFEVMVPVLAVAALLKYISCSSKGGCKGGCGCNCKCCSGKGSCDTKGGCN